MSVHASAERVARPRVVGGHLERTLWTLVPFGAALLAGALVLLLSGRDPLVTYALLVEQAFGGHIAIGNTLAQTTPVLFTGLATALAFRAGVFNVGVEGSLYLGAFAAAWVGFTFVGAPGPLLLLGAFGTAGLAGAAWSFLPGLLRARWRVDEVVTTLMLNFVAINLTSYLVNGPFLAVGTANSMSPLVDPAARLGSLIPPSQVSIGFVLALGMALGFGVVFGFTALGYELRVSGTSPRFAAASGISIFRVIVVAMLISGLIAGIAGAVQVLGVNGRFIDRFSPGYGFTGIAAALLGRNTALGCVLAALFFGALSNGSAMMQLFTDIPLDLVNVLSGTVMIFAVLDVARLRPRRLREAG
ncbi:MAG: ABC transporter permease [Anaerolinea sp.]|nr:ABC transporter permease [Anaerolinea sp.]